KLVDETPGAAAIFRRLTREGIKTFESSRFKEVPKVSSPEATKRASQSSGLGDAKIWKNRHFLPNTTVLPTLSFPRSSVAMPSATLWAGTRAVSSPVILLQSPVCPKLDRDRC